ncbi:MAG: autotransporter-associated beta strand repeat-containing protein [Thermoguttaceae bacterium]|nr:autotransporter-associated beta strand repeat-containing protein [Thermoguttaceae bacterium]MBQ6616714.1 autotransporter-associated beta strand repeat-containing protein [Thermoguttaceae bacterium]
MNYKFFIPLIALALTSVQLASADTYILNDENATVTDPQIADDGETNAIVSSGTARTYVQGTMTILGDSTINNSNRLEMPAAITADAPYTITKVGAGQLLFMNDSSAVGKIVITAGQVVAQNNVNSLNAINGVYLNAGSLQIWNMQNVPGTIYANGGTLQSDGGNNSFTGNIVQTKDLTVDVNGSYSFDTTGTISGEGDNVYRINKTGAGTWNIQGPVNCGYFDMAGGTVNVKNGGNVSGTQLVLRQTNATDTFTFTVDGGTATFTGDDHRLGHWPNHVGVVNVNSGTLSVANTMSVGWDGTGKLYQTGGTTTFSTLDLYKTGSLMEFSGGETNVTTLNIGVRRGGSQGAAGKVTFKGNSVANISYLYAYHTGTLEIQDNANVTVANEAYFVQANKNNATFIANQTGGTFTVNKSLALGHYPDATVTYNMSGGTLNVPNYESEGQTGFWLAVDGNGTLNQSGGTINTGRLNLNARDNRQLGTYVMTGGTLNVGTGGIMATQSGAGRYVIQLQKGTVTAGAESLTANRGNWTSPLNMQLTGTVTTNESETTDNRVTFKPESGYTITLTGILSGDGGLIKDGAGTLILNPSASNNTYTGETTVKAGTLKLSRSGSTGSLAPGSKIIVEGSTAVLAGTGDILGYKAGAIGAIYLNNGGTFKNDTDGQHVTVNNPIYMNNGVITGTGAGSDNGNFFFDNAFHVTGGTDNAITANAFTLRDLVDTHFEEGDFAGKIDVAEGAKLTVSSQITAGSTASLTKTGKGELVLTGQSKSAKETFVNDGTLTLQYAKDGYGTLAAGSTVTVDGATAVLAGHGDILGYTAGALGKMNLLNGGTFKNDATDAHITVNNAVYMNNGVITAEGNGNNNVGNFYFDNTIHVTGGINNVINAPRFTIRSLNGTSFAPGDSAGKFDVAEGAKLTISSNILANSNTPLIKAGDGELVLTNNNTFDKNLVVNGGVLDLTEGKLYAGAYVNNAHVYVNDGGTLKVNNFGYSEGGRASLGGLTYKHNNSTNVHLNGGVIEIQETFADPIGRNIELQENGGTFDIAENVNVVLSSNIHGAGALHKDGAGTLELTYANEYTGGTTVDAGKVLVSGAGTLGTGAISVAQSAELEFNVDENAVKQTGAISGLGTVVKTGSGTLRINNEGADASLKYGNILAQDGRVDVKGLYAGAIEVSAPAIFSPGNSVGTLTTDEFILNAAATLLMEQDSTGMDKLVASTFNIDDDAIIEYVFTSIQPGATYEIFNDPEGLEGKYADVGYWSSYLTPGDDYYWNFSTDGYSIFASVDANAVPEPSTWALLVLGAAGLLYWRRKNS